MRPWRRGSPASVVPEPLAAARLVDLGRMEYAAAYDLQQRLVERRRGGSLAGDLFLLVEHPPTFTLGRRGGRENLMVAERFLHDRGIPLVHIERGGDITYHGPGQVVLYPILHLHQAKLSVAGYVERLEEVMLRLAATCGVTAARDPRNHGVWVGNAKLGSIGIAIRHGIAFHGLALNVDIDLTPFSWVNPCGLSGVAMTSLSRERGERQPRETIIQEIPMVLGEVFARSFDFLNKEQLDDLLCP